jgi:uncharacterized membrane protein
VSILIRLRTASNRFRESLFYLPALFVVGSVVLAHLMLAIDDRVDGDRLPVILMFTVDSARELLSTVAGATITVAGIVFALTALTVQLASSQFSPRVVRGFLRDRFQQTAIGFMVGTFTYALLVLRAVRSPDGDAGDVVPNLSAGLALVLAIAAVMFILAHVNHTAHALQASELIRRVTDETTALVAKRFSDRDDDGGSAGEVSVAAPRPLTEAHLVRATSTGWMQQVNEEQLADAVDPGGVIRVEHRVGDFVHTGGRLCTVWSPSGDREDLERCVNRAVALGKMRTMQQDVSFGIRQLVDIALRALSTGDNDATTAYECIVHLGAVLHEILERELPERITEYDGRWVLRPHEPDHDAFVELAFEQIRVAVAPMPHLSTGFVNTLGVLIRELDETGRSERAGALRHQVELLVAGVEAADPLPADVDRVRRAADEALAGKGSAVSG